LRSIRETVAVPVLSTQAAPSPTAMLLGALGGLDERRDPAVVHRRRTVVARRRTATTG
jgi:hypothetical protein